MYVERDAVPAWSHETDASHKTSRDAWLLVVLVRECIDPRQTDTERRERTACACFCCREIIDTAQATKETRYLLLAVRGPDASPSDRAIYRNEGPKCLWYRSIGLISSDQDTTSTDALATWARGENAKGRPLPLQ